MTVIAASVAEGRMAADRWCMDGDLHFPMRKVHRLGGALVGFAGDVVDINTALAWMRKGRPTSGKPSGNVTALILSNSGLSSWTPQDGLVAVPAAYAIGSGGACALVALTMGADVRRAVVETCKWHNQCGGGVSVYRLRSQ
jgi:hypothetical protein